MEYSAKITSKGQLTLPAALRQALGLSVGDRVVFNLASETPPGLMLEDAAGGSATTLEAAKATMAKAPDLMALAGTVPVPPRWQDADWARIRREAWRRHGLERHARSRPSPE